MKKAILSSVLTFLLFTFSYAVSISKIDTTALLKTTTIVILEDENEGHNKALKSALNKEWKKTPLKFIKKSPFKKDSDKYTNNKSYSFFVTSVSKINSRHSRTLSIQMDINHSAKAGLVYRGEKICKAYTDTKRDPYTLEAEFTKDILYIIHSVFKTNCYMNDLNKNGNFNYKKVPNELNKNPLPLHLCKNVAETMGQGSIKRCNMKIVIISREDLSKAIIEKKKNFIYYDHFTTANSSTGFVVKASDGTPIYGQFGVGSSLGTLFSLDRMLKGVLKKLNK